MVVCVQNSRNKSRDICGQPPPFNQKKTETTGRLIWMDILRGIAVLSVVMHHWLLFMPYSDSNFFSQLNNMICGIEGTVVHLFFILSGTGLSLSYFNSIHRNNLKWTWWATNKITKVILPYFLVILLTYLLYRLLYPIFNDSLKNRFGLGTLFAYITFLRNFYPDGSYFNPTLWFMPVILGLYLLFPILIKLFRQSSRPVFIAISLLITYGSIVLCIFLGYPVKHQSALPFFFVIEFSIGMIVGYSTWRGHCWVDSLKTLKFVFIGACFYILSWALTRYFPYGNFFNDLLTAFGVFLPLFYFSHLLIEFSPRFHINIFQNISRESYIMYLIHGPIILYILRPFLTEMDLLPLHPAISILCSFIFAGSIYFFSRFISPTIYSISKKLLPLQ